MRLRTAGEAIMTGVDMSQSGGTVAIFVDDAGRIGTTRISADGTVVSGDYDPDGDDGRDVTMALYLEIIALKCPSDTCLSGNSLAGSDPESSEHKKGETAGNSGAVGRPVGMSRTIGTSRGVCGASDMGEEREVYYVTYVSEAYFVHDDNVTWWVDSRATVHVSKDRCWFNTYESLDNGSILHMENESIALVLGRGCVDLRVWVCRAVVRLIDPKLKTYVKEALNASLLDMLSIPRLLEAINDEIDSIMGNNTWVLADLPPGCKWIFKRKLKYHKTVDCYGINSQYDYSSDGCEDNFFECKFDETDKRVIICLYVDDMLIFGTDQVQVDLTKEFLSSKFSMKDIREAYVILVSTPIDTNEKLMLNNGQAVSQLEYSRVIGCLMYAMTCTQPDIAFVVGKLSRYTSNTGLTMESEFVAQAAAGKKAE
nr:zinc finger, CCHC-type [Tanacetum cinerariifolium]